MNSNSSNNSVTIEQVQAVQLEEILPLISAYQKFYGKTPDESKNKTFFYELSRDQSKGIQFCARDSSKKVVGFATLYFNFSSLKPGQICILNDLYVDDSCRGQGVGKELIKYSRQYASEKGFDSLTWVTASDNVAAQKLYDSLTKDKSLWFEYQLK